MGAPCWGAPLAASPKAPVLLRLDPVCLAAAADVVLLELGPLQQGAAAAAEEQLQALATRVGALLPSQEILDSERYRRAPDRLRALSSRLLQRLLLSSHCSKSPKSILIERKATRSKPIWRPSAGETADFVHFNVSHDEGLVVFGASRHLVGVDCMRCSARGRDTAEFLQQMKSHCTQKDWAYVMGAHLKEQQLRRFMRVWTVKEAFVKALGTGIYIEPERLQCFFPAVGPPSIALDGAPQTDFYFRLEEEEAPGYIICVCVGPPSRAIEAYKKCMQRDPEEEEGAPITTTPPSDAWAFRGFSFAEFVAAADAAIQRWST
ncbi:4'-phosphopantetheinyl transferase, putative [Eimeria tenella]|uniref:holo-[acyl-carrier-protein] synthase n=1 Tax=Eimeria tenella TaxID=5802 RepID=U6KNQ9_EIMTE|nr:4'-phosphopantetheinyl transferase, putative [Eimeria tenella]CDJ39616.1 4'-phosphopantetheinyl transferase, putative [Eimeria tenella]|eukprot:XP_013230371.1 4'-phosphopantetheinyl transferase, putative [Eimeria tenella]